MDGFHQGIGEGGLYLIKTNENIALIIFILSKKDVFQFRFMKIIVLTNIYINISNRMLKILSLMEYIGMHCGLGSLLYVDEVFLQKLTMYMLSSE